MTNYGHLVLFSIFFLMTTVQACGYPGRTQLLIAAAAVLAMGIYVEVAEGLTGRGHCRLRDLIPDAAGALIGAVLLFSLRRFRKSRRSARAITSAGTDHESRLGGGG